MIKSKQQSINDVYTDCLESFENDKPKFLSMLEEHLDINALIPLSFRMHFNKHIGRPREYLLSGFILALIIQRIFSITTDKLLILFLTYSRELRDFCGFDKVPDASKFTLFKQDFKDDLKAMFDNLVDITEPICQDIDSKLASMTIFDTSGIEAYVRENNPKFINALIRRLNTWKAVKGLDDSFDPYKAAYGLMPTYAEADPAIKQMYINGHFCYSYKFGIITNGLGIVRDISFYDENYYLEHPEIEVSKKDDSPDENKSLADSKALLPTLQDFFEKHPLIKPFVFLGDSAFDSIDIYKELLGEDGLGFSKAFIPLNSAHDLKYPDCPINEDGVPCCPNDPILPMKPETSNSHLRCGMPTFKFVCPMMSWVKCEDGKYIRRTSCENPCTDSPCGRMFYVYPEKNLRTFPGTIRGTEEWDDTYKIRVTVEKSINHFKNSFCVAGQKTRNALTSEADLYLAGITQLVTVLLADSIHQHKYIRSLKPLISA
ncbi:MAG TPA: ISNCY family transposase [Clostridiales bacterium]|nr:ISNCY family transposase [Clostridiales bacterium]